MSIQKFYFSKSRFCNWQQCEKRAFLEKHKPEEKVEPDNTRVFAQGTMVGNVAKKLLGDNIDIEFNEDLPHNKNLAKMMKDTKKAIAENENCVITEASFSYNHGRDHFFCSVDLLKKVGDKYEIYEVKSSTETKKIYQDDASYQYYVLKKLGYDVERVCIVHLNKNYVRGDELDYNGLFTIDDITEIAKEQYNHIEDKVEEIKRAMTLPEEPQIDIGLQCNDPYPCPYFTYCTRDSKKPNVFDIVGMSYKVALKWYYQGIITFQQLRNQNLSARQKEQIMYEIDENLQGKTKIELEEIKEFLQTIPEETYYLDFETNQQIIPLYKGIKVNEQVPFQYSLHRVDKEGNLTHREFLAKPGVDPRRQLAEQLVKDIPLNSCTLAYSMSVEKGVIKRLANAFPDLADHLMNIHDNIKDLRTPFQKRWYYNKDMLGRDTIKLVLPAVFKDNPELDYHYLAGVHNGVEAMNAYENMANLTPEEQAILREQLLRYCELDTKAMVELHGELKRLVK